MILFSRFYFLDSLMVLQEQISSDFKAALKSGDVLTRSVLGMLKSAIQNKEIEKRKKEEGLSEAEIQEVIRSEIKKRSDAVEAFKIADHLEQSESEKKEAEILKKYLPAQLAADQIKIIIEKVLKDAGSKSKKDFGRIMGLVMKELAGQADGNKVKAMLEEMLE